MDNLNLTISLINNLFIIGYLSYLLILQKLLITQIIIMQKKTQISHQILKELSKLPRERLQNIHQLMIRYLFFEFLYKKVFLDCQSETFHHWFSFIKIWN